METESIAVVGKIEKYFRRENKANKKQRMFISYDVEIYVNTYAQRGIKIQDIQHFRKLSKNESSYIYIWISCNKTGSSK